MTQCPNRQLRETGSLAFRGERGKGLLCLLCHGQFVPSPQSLTPNLEPPAVCSATNLCLYLSLPFGSTKRVDKYKDVFGFVMWFFTQSYGVDTSVSTPAPVGSQRQLEQAHPPGLVGCTCDSVFFWDVTGHLGAVSSPRREKELM